MKKIFLIGALCFLALTESADAKSVKLWTAGGNDDGRGLAVKDNDRTICPKGKTKSGSVCVNCDTVLSNCEWCSSTTECTKCKKGYLVKNGKCKKDGCDTNEDCEENQSCNTQIKKCEKLECPRGTYLNNHKCSKCPDECTECTGATVCTACKTNYELAGKACTKIQCAAGQYVEHSECHPCAEAIENCGECETAKTCTKCENGTVLEYGKCVEPKCKTNADCADSEKCNDISKLCEKVVCDDGYEVSEHTCLPIKGIDPECNENTDCEDDEVCIDGGTETAACIPLECKDPNQKVENHECVTDECQGKKVGTCAYLYETCPTGWEQVSTTPSCKVCNPKVDGYNGEPCASGVPQCNTNDDCAYYQVCSDHKCVNAKSCEDLRPPSRYRSTATQGYAGPTYINVVNLSCYIQQGEGTTCKSMGYESSCSAGYGAKSTGKTGSDGSCYTCTMCPEGYYSAGGKDPCTKCSTGTTCGNGAKSSSQCRTEIACSVHEQCASTESCSNDNCGSLAGAQMHGLCNPLSCQAGKEPVNHYCQPCALGYYKSSTGTQACTACPSGKTTNSTGATSSSDCVKIAACTIGSYAECPTGKVCDSQYGETACHTCNSGSNVSTTFKCNCPSDTLSDGKGNCVKKPACTIGSYSECPTGKVCNSQNGETACHVCGSGSNVSTSFKCNCPSDSLSDGKGGCVKKPACTIGSYSECPTGKVCDFQHGETACHTCGSGSNVSTSFKCNCPANTLSDGKGNCVAQSSGSNQGSSQGSSTGSSSSGSSGSCPSCINTTAGCSGFSCSWYGGGKCTSAHKVSSGHVTCDSCSSGTLVYEGSNDFSSCKK